ncbi:MULTISPECIES: polysaccharide biosynthesis tyrosine autokinase [unclassified Roseitalea]|uniref:GumC family protein n=1 Tax=unclassified Roseitalea TaxID=2639107 RepID=UPI00273EA21E|nr:MULTISPECIES: polysaccharide biosynthesis tyrosine autokinase [unclassified Roseitalea]
MSIATRRAHTGAPAARAFAGGPVCHHCDGRGQPGDDMIVVDPIMLSKLAWRHRWTITASVSVCLLLGALITLVQTPVYRAVSKIEIVAPDTGEIAELGIAAADPGLRAVETARSRLVSRDLAGRVVEALDLTGHEGFLAAGSVSALIDRFASAGVGSAAAGPAGQWAETARQRAIDRLADGLTVSAVRDTAIVEIAFRHGDPQLAARIVNQAVASFLEQSLDRREHASAIVREFLSAQVGTASQRLERSELALIDYARQAGITLDADERAMILESIDRVSTRLSEARERWRDLDRLVAQIESGAAVSLPQVFASETIQATRRELMRLRAAYRQRQTTLKPGYPEMRRLSAQIGELERQISGQVAELAQSVRLQRDQARAQVDALGAERAALESRQIDFERKNVRYTILRRQVDLARAQYEQLVAALNDVSVGADLRRAGASVIDPAAVPLQPASPRPLLNLGLSLLMAGFVSIAAIYVREARNDAFAGPDDVEHAFGLPVLGLIPSVGAKRFEEALLAGNAQLNEAHHILRGSLQASIGEHAMRTLLITSAVPGEGKTALAFLLAQQFAAIDRRVLLIDADMRAPRLHTLFRADNAFGLSNVLTNTARDSIRTPVFRRSAARRVDFVTSGTLPPSPASLLASDRMGLMIDYCRHRYDLVIIDAPAVDGISDATALARWTDATLFVIAATGTRRADVGDALKRLQAVGADPVGFAMTRLPARHARKPVEQPRTQARSRDRRADQRRRSSRRWHGARGTGPVPDHDAGPFMPDVRGHLA